MAGKKLLVMKMEIRKAVFLTEMQTETQRETLMEIETVIQKEIRKGTLMVILMAMQTVYVSAGEKRWVLRLHQKASTSPSMVPWKVIVRAKVREQIKQTVMVY